MKLIWRRFCIWNFIMCIMWPERVMTKNLSECERICDSLTGRSAAAMFVSERERCQFGLLGSDPQGDLRPFCLVLRPIVLLLATGCSVPISFGIVGSAMVWVCLFGLVKMDGSCFVLFGIEFLFKMDFLSWFRLIYLEFEPVLFVWPLLVSVVKCVLIWFQ